MRDGADPDYPERVQTAGPCCAQQVFFAVGGKDDGESSGGGKVCGGVFEQCPVRKGSVLPELFFAGSRVPGGVLPGVGVGQRRVVEGRIGDYQVECAADGLQGEVVRAEDARPGGCGEIGGCLFGGREIDVDSEDAPGGLCLQGRIALGEHQGYCAGAGARIENAGVVAAYGRTGSEQDTVGPHLHRTALVADGKMLESENVVSHITGHCPQRARLS